MRTPDLIAALAADASTPPARLGPAFALSLMGAAAAAAAALLATLGVRPDIADAAATLRFDFKLAAVVALAIAAAALTLKLSRPGASARSSGRAVLAVAVVLAIAVVVELAALPKELWATRLMGRNAALCLMSIPLLSAAPLAAVLLALRRGAPGSPAGAGAAAGLLAGAIGAVFYATHCVDDSPLFVAVWYPLAIAGVAAVGAALGARLLRW